jgi:hypothetical protein
VLTRRLHAACAGEVLVASQWFDPLLHLAFNPQQVEERRPRSRRPRVQACNWFRHRCCRSGSRLAHFAVRNSPCHRLPWASASVDPAVPQAVQNPRQPRSAGARVHHACVRPCLCPSRVVSSCAMFRNPVSCRPTRAPQHRNRARERDGVRLVRYSQTCRRALENVLSVQPGLVRLIAPRSRHAYVTALRYCSVECQQMHWPLHSTVCCALGTFLPGDTVTLHGLQQRPDLNGRVASVQSFVSGEGKTARWSVDLGGSDECISVKAANLRRHPRRPSAHTSTTSSAQEQTPLAP